MESRLKWKRIAFVLCGVGVCKEFFPSAPFFVEYAMEHGNFTNLEVAQDILPVTIYGHFVSLLIFLVITDFLKYRPVILLGGLSAVACWAITIFSYHTKKDAIIRQILSSIEHSSEVAYITFMYEIVSRTYYKEVTSLIHGSMHAGKFVAGALGQILISYKLLSLERLNYISFAASLGVVIFACFLPGIQWSLYWHPPPESKSTPSSSCGGVGSESDVSYQVSVVSTSSVGSEVGLVKSQDQISNLETNLKRRLSKCYSELKGDICAAYRNEHVFRWSVWWAMSRAIYWQIGLFTESLWKQIEEETHQHPLNGAVDAVHALISTVIAASLPFIRVPWELWAESYLAVIASVQGLMTLWMSYTKNLYIASGCYVVIQTAFEVVFIVGASEIASSLPDYKASFIFGINALLGILIQCVITNLVTTSYGLALSIHHQFFFYGCYSLLLSALFLAFALRRRHKNWKVTSKNLTEL